MTKTQETHSLSKKPLPVEVQLVDRVKACTDCAWFWGGIPPYGPFPAFDWDETFPEALKNGPPSTTQSNSKDPIYWTQVKQVAAPRVEPAVLRGCRKAPIMTIGINPNMTAFFAGAASSTWAYPYFKRPETYAYYYRHATIYQESFDLDDLQDQVVPGSEIRAEHDGSVLVNRSDTYRWLSLVFTYQIDDKEVVLKREEAWLPEQRLVIFARDTRGSEPKEKLIASDAPTVQEPILGVSGIQEGDLIAARIEQTEKEDIRLFANGTGYYERAIPILDTLTNQLQEKGFTQCQLAIGEDISMHDMVGCASPGWSKRYNMPMDWISEKCVDDNRYMFDQLIQSKPRVVVIVSGSSLKMFAPSFVKLGGKMDLSYEGKDPFELLEETTTQRHLLSWDEKENERASFQSRVIVTPHFSYGNNFKGQSRFALSDWQDFNHNHPEAVAILEKHERISERRADEAKQIVFIERDKDPLQEQISPDAWQVLMQCHIDPYALIASALMDEHEYRPLISDPTAQHLDRAPGDCAFCVNDRWQFPEGCDYGLAGT